MNNQDILDKYKKALDILCKENFESDHECFGHPDNLKQLFNSHNIVEKSFSNIARIFNREDALIYSMPCLFYRNNQWYKYNGNNPEQIQLNNATALSENELFKLIKRTLFTREKKDIIGRFLHRHYELDLEELNIIKTHLIEFKYLTIDSQTYQEIKIVLEYLLKIDEKYII